MVSMFKTTRYEPTGSLLRLPVLAAETMVISGLTAAQMRLALTLICLAWDKSGVVTIEKPMLERLTGVTLNTTDRLLAPLYEAKLDYPGHELHGVHVFENIEYDGGRRGKTVGRLRATLTIGFGHFLARGRNRVVTLPADEMREYGSVSSIILRLRLGAMLELGAEAVAAKIRITPEDVSALFGSYGRSAVIKRPSKVTGEIVEHVSLSRAGAVLIEPAVTEINASSDVMRLKSKVTLQSGKWSAITIEASRLTVRRLAPKPVTVPTGPALPTRHFGRLPTRKVVKA